MSKHTTHFDDCGCLSAAKDAEIAKLREENQRLQRREDIWTDHAAEILAKATDPEGNPEQKMSVLEIVKECINKLKQLEGER